ncbi:MAG: hypothetical protein LQ342_006169 [Letrouitia transgressa]|nr:MAG: hypothetical protein LQ342_006169 [Letrouitia transgressa]
MFQDAVAALNTLQTNFSVIDAIRRSGKSMNKQAIPEMIEWCRKTGYEPSDFNRLRLIHIAGTKGKGSTSAFISSILAQYLSSSSQSNPCLNKVGLYTSPHLRFVRERIQINNEPLSEEMFAKYFFEVWDRLEDSARARGERTDNTAKPVYFRFLTLMAFHAYMREGVDTAIIECGIGGEYDSTNVITSPTATGITSLGIDHVAVLGNTIEEIAWHKAGIMKSRSPAFSAPQLPAAANVLQERAAEKNVSLEMIPQHPHLDSISLGLAAPFQRTNASLAIAITFAHLKSLPNAPQLPDFPSLPQEFIDGLQQVRWAGRCEIRREGNVAWHIDSGHTLESIEVAASWFASQIAVFSEKPSSSTAISKPQVPRILLFNQQTRDAPALARALHKTLADALQDERPFTHAVFCTNVTFKDEGYRPDLVSLNTSRERVEALEVQKGLQSAWRELDEQTEVKVEGTIEGAVEWVKEVARGTEGEVMALVTGSVHLVGGFLEVLETRRVGDGNGYG